MKRWLTYLSTDLSGDLAPCNGSFDNFKLDGRLTLQNQIEIAHKGLELRYNGEQYRKGFLIREGSSFLTAKLIKYHKVIEENHRKLSSYCYT